MIETSLHLVTHNIVCIASAIILLGLSFFVFLNGTRRTANVALGLTGISALLFVLSHVIGVNVADPDISRNILMFNLSMLFVAAFNLHAVLALLNESKKDKMMIYTTYISTILITIFFIINPDLFLLPSE